MRAGQGTRRVSSPQDRAGAGVESCDTDIEHGHSRFYETVEMFHFSLPRAKHDACFQVAGETGQKHVQALRVWTLATVGYRGVPERGQIASVHTLALQALCLTLREPNGLHSS